MANIHPTAIVDPQVQLAHDVEIGPGCILTGPVTLGPGCKLIANVIIQGPTTLGKNNTLYPFTCLGYAPQDQSVDPHHPGPGLTIADHNTFREHVTLHRATCADTPTTIGSHNYWMANSHAGHDVTVANHCTIANAVLLAGHANIADHVVFGGGSGVHQLCRVGRLSILAGLISATQDIPPFCSLIARNRIGSLNIIGLRRAGLRNHIKPLQAAFDILFRKRHTNPVAIQQIEQQLGHDPLCLELAQFIRTSKRGICSYLHDDK